MYCKIVDNKIVERTMEDMSGVSGWKVVPADAMDGPRMYDVSTGLIRPKTTSEINTQNEALLLADAWRTLRNARDTLLRDTDAYAVSDRPATTNMPQYRAYLRGLPATYNDTSILSQTAVMDFDAYVASL